MNEIKKKAHIYIDRNVADELKKDMKVGETYSNKIERLLKK